MFVMRHFAGPLVHKLSPIGLLWVSCLLASCGLVALSLANSPITGLLAATIWGTGVCYMWPTMLATAAERFPRGGALLIGLMGTAGTLSINFVLPAMGTIFDNKKISLAGGSAAFNALQPGPELERVLASRRKLPSGRSPFCRDIADRFRRDLVLRPPVFSGSPAPDFEVNRGPFEPEALPKLIGQIPFMREVQRPGFICKQDE